MNPERWVSLAAAVAALSMHWRYGLGRDLAGEAARAALSVGAVLAVVHALGLEPSFRLLRWGAQPIIAWPLTAAGVLAMVLVG
ncbi:MAG: hypothetical protein FJX46_08205 [Alphaproteobacteria bacterium]|nr:hypothetical protein [Alphaproteobacteria bacterium]